MMCLVCFRSGKQINGEALSSGAAAARSFFRRQRSARPVEHYFRRLSLYLFVYRKLSFLFIFRPRVIPSKEAK
jgi:hypothetical protein